MNFAVVQRAIPMAALLGVRLAALGARAALGSGSPAALRHYAAMEVGDAELDTQCEHVSVDGPFLKHVKV